MSKLRKCESVAVLKELSEVELADIEALLRVNNIVVSRAFLATILNTTKLYLDRGSLDGVFTIRELNDILKDSQRKYPENKIKQ
jgi:hypothetical protein